MRLRREATDSCRFLLPASTLTNIGVTINARSLEHAITKLLSSDLVEEQELGEELKMQGRSITPTLVKYADYNEYIAQTREAMRDLAVSSTATRKEEFDGAKIVHFDAMAEQKIVAALLYRFSEQPYEDVWRQVGAMSAEQRESVLSEALKRIGPHDAPLRELELVDYVFDLTMDYGAYREFKRHRMQSYVSQPLTTELGYLIPELIDDSGQRLFFEKMMGVSQKAYLQMASDFPAQAQYVVTHAHYRRVLAKMNLRECYHLFQLRTGPQAHFSLQKVMRKAMEAVITLHPALFHYIQLRDS
jgi:thymidylate synthase ThyX